MKIILVSHGPFSKGLLESVQMILGDQEGVKAYCLMPEETPAKLSERLEAEIKASGQEEILFLTDLYHGSPFNVVVSLMKEYSFYHITGVNLPLLICAIMSRNEDISGREICKNLMEQAAETILDVNALLERRGFKDEEHCVSKS